MGFLIAIIFNGGGRLCQPALAQLPHLQQRIVGGWKSLEVKSKYVRAAVIADVVVTAPAQLEEQSVPHSRAD